MQSSMTNKSNNNSLATATTTNLGMQALADLLKISHRGFFIPPRPDKNAVEGPRANEEFVEIRRAALERYILQLAAHPDIVQSDVSSLRGSSSLRAVPLTVSMLYLQPQPSV